MEPSVSATLAAGQIGQVGLWLLEHKKGSHGAPGKDMDKKELAVWLGWPKWLG